MPPDKSIIITWISLPIKSVLLVFDDVVHSIYLSFFGYILITLGLLSLAYFIGIAIKLAIKGERALIWDVVNHEIRDPATNEIMLDMDAGGTIIRSHDTDELLCKLDFDKQDYVDNDNNIISFHTLDKEWLKKKATKGIVRKI